MDAARDLVLFRSDARELEGWSAGAASGARSRVSLERGALRFDFELAGAGWWAIARREVALELPAHYVVTLRLRGEAPMGELQLKWVDASGANERRSRARYVR